ncbi:hypothetical protein BM1_04653 [Bipolaris maydis]|nr:hypothetical protein BM1_04653 [Bipolaris maydis]
MTAEDEREAQHLAVGWIYNPPYGPLLSPCPVSPYCRLAWRISQLCRGDGDALRPQVVAPNQRARIVRGAVESPCSFGKLTDSPPLSIGLEARSRTAKPTHLDKVPGRRWGAIVPFRYKA